VAALAPAPAPSRIGKKAKRKAHAQDSALAKKLKSSNTASPKKKQEETVSCEEKGEDESQVEGERGSESHEEEEKPAAKPVAQLVAKQESRKKDETSEEIDEEYAKEGNNSSEKEASEGSEEASDDEMEGLEEVSVPDKTSIQKDKSFSQKMPNASAPPGLKTLFLGNLAFSADMTNIYQFFEDAVDVRLAAKDDGSLRGYGYVDFATEEAAMKAMEKNGQELCGRCVKLDFARKRNTPSGKQDGSNSNGKGQKPTAFVRGFDKSQEEDDVAYVEFKDTASLCKALELNDNEFSVETAKEKSGGRRGGGRFFGGRDRSSSGGHGGGGIWGGGGGVGSGRQVAVAVVVIIIEL
ncbi:hypothetical protein KI387_001932, partial [Taxus chinensis]